MRQIRVLKPCSIEIDGVKHSAKVGELFTVSGPKADKIESAGFAEPVYTAEEIRATTKEFGDRDTGNCFPWIKQQYPSLWSAHMIAFRKGDLDTARRTYNAMLEAWEQRNAEQQPDLLAA
jgi:hypothetical protein